MKFANILLMILELSSAILSGCKVKTSSNSVTEATISTTTATTVLTTTPTLAPTVSTTTASTTEPLKDNANNSNAKGTTGNLKFAENKDENKTKANNSVKSRNVERNTNTGNVKNSVKQQKKLDPCSIK